MKLILGCAFENRKPLSKALTIIYDKPILDQKMRHLVNKKYVIDIAILNGAEAEAKYGIMGINGTLLIFVKSKVKFIDLVQLL